MDVRVNMVEDQGTPHCMVSLIFKPFTKLWILAPLAVLLRLRLHCRLMFHVHVYVLDVEVAGDPVVFSGF